jgi:predicted nucleic acid-binding protein
VLIYCDSVILIYFLDQTGHFNVRATNRLAALRAAGDTIAVSDLSRLECRVGPMRRVDAAVLAVFDQFFVLPDVRIVPLTTAVYDRATTVRAAYDFKTVDALHLAAAAEARCYGFLTNDNRLSLYSDVPVEILP